MSKQRTAPAKARTRKQSAPEVQAEGAGARPPRGANGAVLWRRTTDLRPDPRNARAHPEEQLAMLVESIRRFGFNAPIGVDADGVIVFGHGRLEAAKRLGLAEVPTIQLDHLDERARRAYAIADNRIAELAEWNEDELRRTLAELVEGQDMDLLAVGFDAAELAKLLDTDEPEPVRARDELPESKGKAITEPGDMWRLGEHLVLCAPAEDEASWERLCGNDPAKAACVFTDLPYGIDYRGANGARVKNDELTGAKLQALLARVLQRVVPRAREDAAFYLWHATAHRHEFEGAMAAAGLVERQVLVWVKPTPTLGHGDYQWAHEPCYYASREGQRPAFHGGRDQATVWRFALAGEIDQAAVLGQGLELVDGESGSSIYVLPRVPKGKKARRVVVQAGQLGRVRASDETTTAWEVARERDTEHPTTKPVDLVQRALANSTRAADVVIDPFLGSGSTLIACEVSARICRGTELDPKWCDLIVRRWERLTGKKAELVRGIARAAKAKRTSRRS